MKMPVTTSIRNDFFLKKNRRGEKSIKGKKLKSRIFIHSCANETIIIENIASDTSSS